MITKAERGELRSIVRQQFKVLRHELDHKEAELKAEMEQRIAARYADVDEERQKLLWRAHEVCQAASREITDLLAGTGALAGHAREKEVTITQPVRVVMEHVEWSQEDRQQLRRAMVAGIDAQISGAKLGLDRQEADLLRTLAVGAIESEEARQFLGSIPTVGELVPVARLAELEAEFDTGEADGMAGGSRP